MFSWRNIERVRWVRLVTSLSFASWNYKPYSRINPKLYCKQWFCIQMLCVHVHRVGLILARCIYRYGQRLRRTKPKAWTKSGRQSVLLRGLQTLVRCCSLYPSTKMAWHNNFTVAIFISLDSACLCAFVSLVLQRHSASLSNSTFSSFCFGSTLSSSQPSLYWCWHTLTALYWP